MRFDAASIDGVWVVTPRRHEDHRGVFLEWYRADLLAETAGRELPLAQANISVSARGAIRGIHFADSPPGQAKYVTCVSGAIMDVVVDIRVGSPTFGHWEGIRLDDRERRAVYLADGLGHGFCALTPAATVLYMTSSRYDPGVERALDPLDPAVGIRWPTGDPVLSDRDRAAPTLAELQARDLLPGMHVVPHR
ncbi:dTDP-4-dehydrorhamnose 3,5-epimerase family protein [Mangrovihabitans endophyticus]|uniref:dTDP-4-dehydrorhamnose 3,5-epimerase RmlC n=1 Tax=Mangrovihabitans endophyticus TaxID=1751298 RepID=A0A8J3FME7_9ACTN|nr:dTDP-4-dehydrorhamnose 3,5-epimerase [Mangrovihabitans endophyticus]GGK72722.1 DTDP-4-dehydrorhamnose 3,5-epimerase RmlC [Mangrovihabitans endophyticus]